jgi:Domain of unknown function (DUF397)
MRHITVTTTNCCCFRSTCSPCAHNLLHTRSEWLIEVTTAPRKYYTYAKVVHHSAGHARRARIFREQVLQSNRWCASQLDGEIANTLHTVTWGGPCRARVIAGVEVLQEGGGLVSRVIIESEIPQWRKATRSIGNGDCVEIAPVSGTIAVRDSKDPAGPVLRYSADAWKAFLSEAGQGDFD